MHQGHVNMDFVRIIIIGIMIVLSSMIVCAQETEKITPDSLLHISIKGTDNIILENSWVTPNRESLTFPIYRFAEEFKISTCKNKYYYELKTDEDGLYWNHFCPKGVMTWDGALTIREDLEHKQNSTTIVLPFFEQAKKVEFLDKDAKVIISMPLTKFSRTKEKLEDIVKPIENITQPIDPQIDVVSEEHTQTIEEQEMIEESPAINNNVLYIILGGVLVLVIIIAILIMKIKNQQPPQYNQYQ